LTGTDEELNIGEPEIFMARQLLQLLNWLPTKSKWKNPYTAGLTFDDITFE